MMITRSWAPEIYDKAVNRWVSCDLRFETKVESDNEAVAWSARNKWATDCRSVSSLDPVNARWDWATHRTRSLFTSWGYEGSLFRFRTKAEAAQAALEVDEEEPPKVSGTNDLPTHVYDWEVGLCDLPVDEIATGLDAQDAERAKRILGGHANGRA
jgi:hypothetical protein